MRVEFKGTAHYAAERYADLRSLLRQIVARRADAPAYLERPEPRADGVQVTYAELAARIDALGTALLAPAFEEDEEALNPRQEAGFSRRRLAVLGDNTVDWIVCQNAALFGAGLAVPLDKQLSLPEVRNLLQRARVATFFLDAGKSELVEGILQEPGTVRNLVLIGKKKPSAAWPLLGAEESREAMQISTPELRVWCLEDLLAAGREQLAAGDRRFQDYPIDGQAPSAIFFTSGTTAASKGVVLSQANILQVVYSCRASIQLPVNGMTLSLLPLHHTLENAAQYVYWEQNICAAFNDGLRYISGNLHSWPIQMLVTVPLLLENIQHQVEQGLVKKGLKRKVDSLMKLSALLRRVGLDLRGPLFRKIREAIGPELKYFIVGAAPLKAETESFYDAIGMELYLGYGLTEAAPLLTANNQVLRRSGSVGQAFAGVTIRIDEGMGSAAGEGEILAQGPNIMLGYYEDPEATAEVLKDGWLHTGDIGHLSDEGALFITGRAKSMIVLTNGKKVFPEELESLLQGPDWLEQVMVYGADSQRESIDVAALFQVKAEAIETEEARVREELSALVQKLNERVPPYKAIKYWSYTSDSFVMTSTLKIKRQPTTAAFLRYVEEAGGLPRDFAALQVRLKA